MNKAPAFQFYAQDFLTGVIYLTNEEIGIYIKMLCKQWTDGQIPKKRLGFLVGFDWDKLSDELKDKFIDHGDYVVNERLEDERAKKENFFKKQSLNGKKGGRPRKDGKPKQNPNKTQKKPLEDEVEKEKEIINSFERGQGENFSYQDDETTAYNFLYQQNPIELESFEMQNKKSFPQGSYKNFIENFNCKVIEEDIEFTERKLFARLRRLNSNWNKRPEEKETISASERLNLALGLTREGRAVS